ncbi:TetR family transcriptional regulator [filamentous cyanobacterium CCP1]|nr:TetR family transcriptional regulator [filamentous cyanobacterium CCP2]PSB65929.1 TetR family transcriptional regulator [filamentous cyanobacterium CCP1]
MGQINHSKQGTPIDRPKSTEKTEAILAGAMQEFLAHGYAATTMDRVASAAKVSKATVYSYFQDKESLFASLMERLVQERFSVALQLESELWQADPDTVLRQLTTNLLDAVISAPEVYDFMRLIVGESGRFPALAHAYVQHIAQPILTRLTTYLASRSELNLPDPEATARVIVGTIVYYIILQEVMHGKEILPMERDRLIDSLVFLITGR